MTVVTRHGCALRDVQRVDGFEGDKNAPCDNFPRSAPVAQWIEQPPPKGQVGRSIRLLGANEFAL